MEKPPFRIRLLILALRWDFRVMNRLEIILNWLDEWHITRNRIEIVLIAFTSGCVCAGLLALQHTPLWLRFTGPLIGLLYVPPMYGLHTMTFQQRLRRRFTIPIAMMRVVTSIVYALLALFELSPHGAARSLCCAWIMYVLFIHVIDCVSLEPPKKRKGLSVEEIKKMFGVEWVPQPLEGMG